MKKTLKEQIERIHTLTYGKTISKDGFLTNLMNEGVQKIDDPKKADFVGTDSGGQKIKDKNLLQDFYNTLDKASSEGGLKQQQSGSYSYQKGVESMQIGLMLLGYDLPVHGVDGLFGPETARAVTEFMKDNNVNSNNTQTVDENSGELRSTLSSLGYSEKGREITSGGEITDELSSIVSKILREFKAQNPNVKITITSGNDDFHKNVGYKSKHTEGKAVDLTLTPYNSTTANAFLTILKKYKSEDNNFNYIDEYSNPSAAATGGHFHLQYATGSAQSSDNDSSEFVAMAATPEMLDKLILLLKSKNITPQELKTFMDKNVYTGSGAIIDVKDWQGIIDTIINNLEGGYYHPDMLRDGRVKDNRYGASGETMFGVDRKTGPESKTPAGLEFWKIIDDENARENWQNEHGFGKHKLRPGLERKLRSLVAEMEKPLFETYSKRYLSPESGEIVSNSKALMFHFAYATFNGEGWFKRFAKVFNNAVAKGITDPDQLLKIAMDDRLATNNSLMRQVAPKVKNITDKISTEEV